MKLRRFLYVAVAGLTLNLPVSASETDPFDKVESTINPEALFRGVIREDDVSLLFRHIRQSIAAAARGEEVRDSEELMQRQEVIAHEIALRSSVVADALLNAFEAAARQAVREEFGATKPRELPRLEATFPDQYDN